MLPLSIRCNTCGTYIYKGTKFNSRKEDAVGEYSGSTSNVQDDPRSSPLRQIPKIMTMLWNLEHLATLNHGLKRKRTKQEVEEMGDAMKSVENRAMDSKMDMGMLAALEESRDATVSSDLMLEALRCSTVAELAQWQTLPLAKGACGIVGLSRPRKEALFLSRKLMPCLTRD
ncbi:hypothetical protein Taro_025854 [Colocasia esculenta]|uniref:Uncharacterized protein n=1 Tax=Colocasia esculenta TaxID=4460 RepID=A0A843VDE4_COLES|nr:hypothetical protein [Colocasia esculenta]